MDTWATRLGGLLLLLLAAWALSTLPHRRELKRLNQRESIGDEEVYRRYYADSGLSKVSVREVWMEIATTLRAPPDKLRPTDRFGKDVGTYLVTSEELDDLFELAQCPAKRRQVNLAAERLVTVDDYVRALAETDAAGR
jgi:hypothetical protein